MAPDCSQVSAARVVGLSPDAYPLAGLEYNDTVALGGLSIANQTIGVAQFALGGFEGVDGILGWDEPPTISAELVLTFSQNWSDRLDGV